MRNAWAKFYSEWGALMTLMSHIFSDYARRSYLRSARLYGQEAFDLAEMIGHMQFTDQPDSDGKGWDFEVVHDPVEPLLPLANPILPDGKGGWVYGIPPRGTFDNGSFDDPHGEDGR